MCSLVSQRPKSVTLTNVIGAVGGSEITIDPSQSVINPNDAGFSFNFRGPDLRFSCLAGATTEVELTFAPQVAGLANANIRRCSLGCEYADCNIAQREWPGPEYRDARLYVPRQRGWRRVYSDTPVWDR